MDFTEKVLAVVPANITVQNAFPSSQSILTNLKTLQNESEWNQQIADSVGNSAVTFAQTWTNTTIPPMESEIASLKSYIEGRESNLKIAENDLKRAKQNNNTRIVKAAQDTVNTIEGQISDANRKIRKLKENKTVEEERIQDFLLGILELKLMNESIAFLRMVKESNISLSNDGQRTFYGRLFFMENAYREQFKNFEQIITDTKDTYAESAFYAEADGLHYFAKREIQNENLSGTIKISLDSEDASSATLCYNGDNLFSIPKKSVEKAQSEIGAICKNYTLETKNSDFTVTLNKIIENANIAQELTSLTANADAYAAELSAIIAAVLANGGKVTLFQKIKTFFRNAKSNNKERSLKNRNKNTDVRLAEKKEKAKKKRKILLIITIVMFAVMGIVLKIMQ